MPININELTHAWNEFFFAPTSAYPVAQFRIFFGCVLLYEATFLARNFEPYFGPDGLVRYSSFARQSAGRALSLFLYLPGTLRSARAIFVVHVTAILCMTAGFMTPVSTVVTYVTVRSFVNRTPMIGNGGDNVAKIMCFLLIFASSGNAVSVDHTLFSSTSGSLTIDHPWAFRLMQIQVSMIYLWTAYWKLGGRTYRDGTASYYAVTNIAYRRLRLPGILLRQRFVRPATWGAFSFEWLIGPSLWIQELRLAGAVSAIIFHLILETLLNLQLFSWYMISCLLLFVDLHSLL
jgi:vitamin K-dependent gamma-carboxylase-like protein